MPKLPVVSAAELVGALRHYGYTMDHQTGSHIILRNKSYPYRRLTVPKHKVIAKGTLRAILRESGLTVEELIKEL